MKEYDVYKYCVTTRAGDLVYKADPYAFHAETRPVSYTHLPPFGETYLIFLLGLFCNSPFTLGRQGAAYSLLPALFRFASARIIHDFKMCIRDSLYSIPHRQTKL